MDIRKKTLSLDRARLTRVRRRLGAGTDAIHGALDWVIESQGVIDDLMAVAGKCKGRFRPVHRRPHARRARRPPGDRE